MTILVYLGPAKKGTSGSFEYELTVPDDVMEVGFGNSAVTIWKREPKGKPAMGSRITVQFEWAVV
jgi:hypothetical protein